MIKKEGGYGDEHGRARPLTSKCLLTEQSTVSIVVGTGV